MCDIVWQPKVCRCVQEQLLALIDGFKNYIPEQNKTGLQHIIGKHTSICVIFLWAYFTVMNGKLVIKTHSQGKWTGRTLNVRLCLFLKKLPPIKDVFTQHYLGQERTKTESDWYQTMSKFGTKENKGNSRTVHVQLLSMEFSPRINAVVSLGLVLSTSFLAKAS